MNAEPGLFMNTPLSAKATERTEVTERKQKCPVFSVNSVAISAVDRVSAFVLWS